jgi:hypothetical protein
MRKFDHAVLLNYDQNKVSSEPAVYLIYESMKF